MRAALVVVGIVLVAVGVVWVFQGVGVLKGSFMTAQAFWAWMGGLSILLGLPVLTRGLRR